MDRMTHAFNHRMNVKKHTASVRVTFSSPLKRPQDRLVTAAPRPKQTILQSEAVRSSDTADLAASLPCFYGLPAEIPTLYTLTQIPTEHRRRM